MKITNVKAMVAKVMTVGVMAGAVVMAAPVAQAQGLRFGIAINVPVRGPVYPGAGYSEPGYRGSVYSGPVYGGSAYGAPAYGGPVYGAGYGDGYYARRDVRIRHEEWVRAHEWERYHRGFYR